MARLGDLDGDPLGQCVHRSLGWLPKYFLPQLVRATNGLLKRNVLFGSDYPVLNPDRWIESFDLLDINPEVRPLVMKENAVELLGLGLSGE